MSCDEPRYARKKSSICPCPQGCSFFLHKKDLLQVCHICLEIVHARRVLTGPKSYAPCFQLKTSTLKRQVKFVERVLGKSTVEWPSFIWIRHQGVFGRRSCSKLGRIYGVCSETVVVCWIFPPPWTDNCQNSLPMFPDFLVLTSTWNKLLSTCATIPGCEQYLGMDGAKNACLVNPLPMKVLHIVAGDLPDTNTESY